MLALLVLLLAADQPEAWRSKVRPLTDAEAQRTAAAARAAAAYSSTVVERNVICRYGTADQCANAEEEVDRALRASADLETLDALEAGNICRAILYLVLEGLEIEARIEAMLGSLKKQPGFGKERLLVMQQREDLRKSNAVSRDAVKACTAAGGAFGKTVLAASGRK